MQRIKLLIAQQPFKNSLLKYRHQKQNNQKIGAIMTIAISYFAGAGWQFFDNNGVPPLRVRPAAQRCAPWPRGQYGLARYRG